MRLATTTLMALILVGCSNLADYGAMFAGMGVVESRVDTFDGATVVTVTPNKPASDQVWGATVGIGGRWTSNSPDHVAVILEYSSSTSYGNAYTSIEGMDVMIDGERHSFEAVGATDHTNSGYNTVAKTIFTESRNRVVMRLATLKDMINAEDCRLRIYTGDGYQDSVFSVERIAGSHPSARMSMREFVAKIDEVRDGGQAPSSTM